MHIVSLFCDSDAQSEHEVYTLARRLRQRTPHPVYVLREDEEPNVVEMAELESGWLLLVFTPRARRSIHSVKRLMERITWQQEQVFKLFFIVMDRSRWRSWYTRIFEYWWFEFRHLIAKQDPNSVVVLWSSDLEEIFSGIMGIARGEENDEADLETQPPASEPEPRALSIQNFLHTASRSDHDRSTGTGFRVHYPKAYVRDQWASMLVYVDSPAEEKRRVPIAQGVPIHVIPHLPGFRFNPPAVSAVWEEERHIAHFRFRNEGPISSDSLVSGYASVYVGPVLIGLVPLSLRVHDSLHITPADNMSDNMQDIMEEAQGEPFRAVFVSYASSDTKIAEALQQASQVVGMPYLRDLQRLRTGQKWSSDLLAKINDADVFQLCWSKAARRSKNVRQELHHALSLGRGVGFIRPCYWEEPLPRIPAELSDRHATFLDANVVGGFQDSLLQRVWSNIPRVE